MKRRKEHFRVGMKVQLASDPTHQFVIARSKVPDRIYFERGTKSWYLKNELQPAGAAECRFASHRLNGKGHACHTHLHALATVPRASNSEPGLPPGMQRCLGCGEPFKPTRKWQRFDRPACRFTYWNRAKSQPAQSEDNGCEDNHRS